MITTYVDVPGAQRRAAGAGNGELNHYKLIVVALAIVLAGLALVTAPLVLKDRIEATIAQVMSHLGLFLVPSGLITLIYEVVLRRSFLAEVREQLSASLGSHFTRVERLSQAGLADVHECLPDERINRELAQARGSIRILQTWIPNLLQIERSLGQAAARGCRVRILLLDASSIHCVERSRDLGYVDESTIADGIGLNLKQLASFVTADLRSRVEVRLYRATPIMSLYACDDLRFLGLFWRKRRCSQGPHLEIGGRDSVVGVEADRHFEDLWADAAPVGLGAAAPAPATAAAG